MHACIHGDSTNYIQKVHLKNKKKPKKRHKGGRIKYWGRGLLSMMGRNLGWT